MMPEHVVPIFIRVRTGLLAPKHIRKMGGGPWPLYLWLHTQVWFSGEHAGTTRTDYTHERAAEALGAKPGSVRRWFTELQQEGYLTTRQLRYGLEVAITNYVPDESRVSTSEQAEASEAPSRVLRNERQSAQISKQGCADLNVRVSTSEHPLYKEDSREVEKSRDVEGTRARASAAAAVDVLDRFNATLTGEKGYEAAPAFLLKVREKYGHLDLEEEALKARDWARRHRRQCSQGYVLNWLKKAAADKAAQDVAAKPVAGKPVVRNEPPPLPGPVVPASPEVRAEYDAIRNGRRPKPTSGTPQDFERKRAEALAQAQARIGAI